MALTFHPFSKLPSELRLAIWEMTVKPREIEVRIVKPTPGDPLEAAYTHPSLWGMVTGFRFDEAMRDAPRSTRAERKAIAKARKEFKQYTPYVYMVSSHIPAVLHTCREARHHGMYKRVSLDEQLNSDSRYVWLNLDIDLVNIGKEFLAYFMPIAPLLKHLKLSREAYPSDEYWKYETEYFQFFSSVETIHVVCLDHFEAWGDYDTFRWCSWPCPLENIVFIDENTSAGRLAVNYEVMEEIYEMILPGYEAYDHLAEKYRAGDIRTVDEGYDNGVNWRKKQPCRSL